MQIHVPELSVVAIIGDDSANKEIFLKKYFNQSELFTIDEEEMATKRLGDGKLAVIHISVMDADTHKKIIGMSKKQHALPVAIIIGEQSAVQEKLLQKGFKQIYVVESQNKLLDVQVYRTKLSNNKRDIHGPFDMIGDVHGCYDELCELLVKLGYEVDASSHKAYAKNKRIVVFCGDLVDRGPKIIEVLKLVMYMVEEGTAYVVLGNHDGKLQRKFNGAAVQAIHGLEVTLEQLEKESESFKHKLKHFLDSLVSHYVFDEGRLVVAHAGLKEWLHGRESKRIRDLAMFGETTGQLDAFGLPVRLDWSEQYQGDALVVYGHTPRSVAKMNNYTINIDTGCVYGGKLTAFRYPEQEIVDVKAKATYYESVRPIS